MWGCESEVHIHSWRIVSASIASLLTAWSSPAFYKVESYFLQMTSLVPPIRRTEHLPLGNWRVESNVCVSVQFASESKDPAVRLDSLGWIHQFYCKPQTAAFASCQPEVWTLAGRRPGPAQIWHLIRPNTWHECIASGPLPALLSEHLLFKTQIQNYGHRPSPLKDFKAWMCIGSIFESNLCMLF